VAATEVVGSLTALLVVPGARTQVVPRLPHQLLRAGTVILPAVMRSPVNALSRGVSVMTPAGAVPFQLRDERIVAPRVIVAPGASWADASNLVPVHVQPPVGMPSFVRVPLKFSVGVTWRSLVAVRPRLVTVVENVTE
jgi:hypothetical protein